MLELLTLIASIGSLVLGLIAVFMLWHLNDKVSEFLEHWGEQETASDEAEIGEWPPGWKDGESRTMSGKNLTEQ